MEKVQKTCQTINQVGEPDQYGNLAYSVAFTDSTSGFFKCKMQNLFTPGVESTFYFGKAVGRSGQEYYKIERVEKHEFEGQNISKNIPEGGKSESNIEQINRSAAIRSAAILLQQSNNNTPERVIEAAEMFFDYINFGIVDRPTGPVKEEPDENALPF